MSGVSFRENRDFLTVDNELTVLGFNGTLETTVNGIVLEHVDHVFQGDEGVVDSNNLNFRVRERSTEDNTTNTTETRDELVLIPTSLYGHSIRDLPVNTNLSNHFYKN